jgi:hypothetical protein
MEKKTIIKGLILFLWIITSLFLLSRNDFLFGPFQKDLFFPLGINTLVTIVTYFLGLALILGPGLIIGFLIGFISRFKGLKLETVLITAFIINVFFIALNISLLQ